MPRIPRTHAWSTLNTLAQRLHDTLQALLTPPPTLRLRPLPVRVQRDQRPPRRL